MRVQEVVVVAAVVGMVVGLLVVPTVAWFRSLVQRVMAAWQMNRSKSKGKAAKMKQMAKGSKKHAVVAADTSSCVPQKRRGRPANINQAAEAEPKAKQTAEGTKKRPGRPAKVKITAEAAKNTKQTAVGAKKRSGRPSREDIFLREAGTAERKEIRTYLNDELNLAAAGMVHHELPTQQLVLASDQLDKIAVMPTASETESFQSTGSENIEPYFAPI